jgi:hypothetical protein
MAAQVILVGLGESLPNWLDPGSPMVDDVRKASGPE